MTVDDGWWRASEKTRARPRLPHPPDSRPSETATYVLLASVVEEFDDVLASDDTAGKSLPSQYSLQRQQSRAEGAKWGTHT